MADDELRKIIGKPMSKSRVVIERGPVANFATAVCDSSRVYRDPAPPPTPACRPSRCRRRSPS